MSEKAAVAVQSIKAAQAEMVQWENRVAGLRSDYENLQRQNAALSAEIDRKRTDFDLYMSAKDAEIKNNRATLMADQEEHNKQKVEFLEIMKKFRQEQVDFEAQKKVLNDELAKIADRRGKIDQFVIALQRAYSLIG